jgi:uncharacterized Zn finger protein (UPF0148 family)
MTTKVKLIEITCPYCKRFLCYVRPDSDVFCPRCQKYVYMGLGGGEAGNARAIPVVST